MSQYLTIDEIIETLQSVPKENRSAPLRVELKDKRILSGFVDKESLRKAVGYEGYILRVKY